MSASLVGVAAISPCSERSLLMLDEPKNFLDAEKVELIKELLRAVSPQRAIVITTHSDLMKEVLTDVIEVQIQMWLRTSFPRPKA
jgi:DNA repair exonuclease SbcCD ATPase subunit